MYDAIDNEIQAKIMDCAEKKTVRWATELGDEIDLFRTDVTQKEIDSRRLTEISILAVACGITAKYKKNM